MAADKRELLLRALSRQYLLQKGPRREVVPALCGLQAQFANNPRYSLQLRASDFFEESWSEGLLKIWSHRNTLHLVLEEELGLYLSAKEGPPRPWEDSWWGIPKAVKPYWSDFIREEIRKGNDQREGLKDACRRAGMEQALLERVFHGWGGLLKEMSDRGLVAYRPGTQKRFVLPDKVVFWELETARLEILTRYFRAYGPATLQDCAAFTGYGMAETRRLFQKLSCPLEELACGGERYFYCRDTGDCAQSGDSETPKLPQCLLLTGFDPMIMGYRDRSRVMDPSDRDKVITCSGIVYPTVLLHGRIRARWQRSGDKLVVTPFIPLSRRSEELISAAVRRAFGRETAVSFARPLG